MPVLPAEIDQMRAEWHVTSTHNPWRRNVVPCPLAGASRTCLSDQTPGRRPCTCMKSMQYQKIMTSYQPFPATFIP